MTARTYADGGESYGEQSEKGVLGQGADGVAPAAAEGLREPLLLSPLGSGVTGAGASAVVMSPRGKFQGTFACPPSGKRGSQIGDSELGLLSGVCPYSRGVASDGRQETSRSRLLRFFRCVVD